MKNFSKKQKIGILAAAAVFIAVIVTGVALLAGRTEGTYRSIKIVEMSGEVTIGRAGVGDLNAAVNMNLVSGDSLHTGENAYVVLMLDTDKYVMLGESGSMEVIAEGDERNGRTSINLAAGSVLSEIQNPLGQGATYEVVTPNATMSVRGTVFQIDRAADGTVSLLVFDGTVALGFDGQEPILYNAGEYMQFEEGDTPRITVEREAITEEVMNGQMQQRLEQINQSGTELNTGSAKLSEMTASAGTSGQEVPESDAASDSAENPAPTEEPASTETPAPTKQPESTATPRPTRTPRPTASPSPTPAPEPQNTGTSTPAPEIQNTWTPAPTHTPWPTHSPWPTHKPTYTVTFINSYVVVEDGGLDWLKLAGNLDYETTYEHVKSGETVKEPEEGKVIPKISEDVSEETTLRLAGWYLENGRKWDFENDVVTSNITLYPAWEEYSMDISGDDAEGTVVKTYWPVIFREAETYNLITLCLPDGTSEIPVRDEESCIGWEKIYGTDADNRMWDESKDKVNGAIALREVKSYERPSWSPEPSSSPTPSTSPEPTSAPEE